jgi:hypothetical protein
MRRDGNILNGRIIQTMKEYLIFIVFSVIVFGCSKNDENPEKNITPKLFKQSSMEKQKIDEVMEKHRIDVAITHKDKYVNKSVIFKEVISVENYKKQEKYNNYTVWFNSKEGKVILEINSHYLLICGIDDLIKDYGIIGQAGWAENQVDYYKNEIRNAPGSTFMGKDRLFLSIEPYADTGIYVFIDIEEKKITGIYQWGRY